MVKANNNEGNTIQRFPYFRPLTLAWRRKLNSNTLIQNSGRKRILEGNQRKEEMEVKKKMVGVEGNDAM